MEEQGQCYICEEVVNKKDLYCDKCLQQQLLAEEEEIKNLEKEIVELQEQISRVRSEVENIETEKIKAQNQQIEIDKKNLDKEFQQLEQTELKQKNELQKLKNQILELEKSEDNLWDHINKFTRKLYSLFENNQIADNKLSQINNELDRLSKLDILNDLFKISIQDEVGCINGLAIGRKGEQPIDWDDIAAGMGHLTLLLVYLMKKFMYPFSKIESVELNGSFTKIRVRDIFQDRECIKSLNLFVQNKTSQKDEEEFSEAFVALFQEFISFCRYLQDGDILRKRKIHLNLPYQMQGITIQDKSVSLKQSNAQKWPNWTDSVKKFLANVKALVVTNAQFDLSL